MLAGAGLVPSGTRTFLVDRPAPLDTAAREFLHVQLSHAARAVGHPAGRGRPGGPGHPAGPGGARFYILVRPDAFYLTAITVHTARAEADR